MSSDVYTKSSVGLLIQPLPVNTLLSCPNFAESFCITSQRFQLCSKCSQLFLPFLSLLFNFDLLILLLSDILRPLPLQCAGVPLRNYLLTI